MYCGRRQHTRTHDLRLRERQRVVADGHVVDARAVQLLRLEEDARVRVADAREQQALRLERAARHHHLHERESDRVRIEDSTFNTVL